LAQEKGLIAVFTGNGKGKTTAALGVILRSLGHGRRVCLILFMKGNFPYGEQAILEKLPGVTLHRFGHLHFVDPGNVKEEERAEARRALDIARQAMQDGYDLIVLDEVNIAVSWGLIDVEDLVRLIEEKPPHVDLVLTGRYAPQRLIELADLVTDMVEVKHPYKQGVKAKKGVDY